MKVKIIYLFNDNRCQFRGNIATFAYFSRDLIQSWVSQLIVDFHLMLFSRMKSNIMPENQTYVIECIILFAVKWWNFIFFWLSILLKIWIRLRFFFEISLSMWRMFHVHLCVYACVKLLPLVSFETKTVKLIAWLHSGARAQKRESLTKSILY